MTRYKQHTAELIESLYDSGRTRSELAGHFGVPPNMISMPTSPNRDERLPVKHLPKLQELTGFSDELALQLIAMHADDYDGCELDKAAVKWMYGCVWRECRRRTRGGGSHVGH